MLLFWVAVVVSLILWNATWILYEISTFFQEI